MKNVLLITDPNEDTDDLVSLIFASALIKINKINLLGIVATVGDKNIRQKRAMYAKGIMNILKTDVPVCVGCDYAIDLNTRKLQDDIFLDSKYLDKILLKGADIVSNAQQFMTKALEQAQDNSVTIVDIAGMTDLSVLIKENSALFNKKVKDIYLMSNFDQTKSKTGYLPDFNAHNNQIDTQAASFVYEYLQKSNIQTFVVNSKNTKKVPVSMKYYEDIKVIDSMISKHAYEIQKEGLKRHYDNILVGKAQEKYTIEWFYKTYTTYKEFAPKPFDEVWKHVNRLYLYDPLTLLACIDEYRENYFECHKFGNLQLCGPKNLDAIYRIFNDLPKIAINF